MIVVDASVLVAFLLPTSDQGERANKLVGSQSILAAPTLIENEIGSALQRLSLTGKIASGRAASSFELLASLRIEFHDAWPLTKRAWELRKNVSFYDACYVALAEQLSCPLYTFDRKLAAAPGYAGMVLIP